MFARARVVEVGAAGWSSSGGRGGSGYIVAPGLVLTAAHVIGGAAGCTIRPMAPADSPGTSAEPVWVSAELDAALLRYDGALPADLRHTRWGRLTGQDSAVPAHCSVVGFVRADDENGDSARDTQGLAGRINPNTGVFDGHYEIELDRVPPQVGGRGLGRWRGLSGSAVFCGDVVAGLVTRAPRRWSSTRLQALPVWRLLEVPGFRDLLADAAGRPVPTSESVELQSLYERPPHPPRSPSYLLDARQALTPFHGRDAELSELLAWCLDPESRAQPVQLVTGPGGWGKTRLAVELIRVLGSMRTGEGPWSQPGWITGFLAEHGPQDPEEHRKFFTGAFPTLIVVDYAEARQEQVHGLLRTFLAHHGDPQVRILLLARSAGAWWEQLRSDIDLARVGICARRPLELTEPLGSDSHGLEERYESVAGPLAEHLASLPAGPSRRYTPPTLKVEALAALAARPRPCRTYLELHVNVLGALLRSLDARGNTVPVSETPEDVVIWHEWKYWKAALDEAELHISPARMRQAVAVQALLSPTTGTEAVSTLARLLRYPLPVRDGDECPRLERVLADFYPPSDLARWGSMHPHVVTARLLAIVDREAPGFLHRVLTGESDRQRLSGIRKLLRAGDSEPLLANTLRHGVIGHPDLLLDPVLHAVGETGDPQNWLTSLGQQARATGNADIAAAADRKARALRSIAWLTPGNEEFAASVQRLIDESFLRLDGDTSRDQDDADVGDEWDDVQDHDEEEGHDDDE
ncbi:trypsin-like serine protease [Streptomyces sp. NPDC087901]|uniref:trypsin-like serine protease n=1 Tax=Streptomyces sp. NPDC087901 TaxID=3365818 RepID=UPI0037FDB19E